jgi:hypothetical protein
MPTSLTKALVERALTAVDGPDQTDLITSGALEWVAACDAFASIKLHLPSATDNAQLMQTAADVDRAVRREAAAAGAAVERLLVQFIDKPGNVIWQTGQAPPPDSPAAPKGGAPAPNRTPATSESQAPNPQQAANPLRRQARHRRRRGQGRRRQVHGRGQPRVGLARRAHAVGLLDGDIYGPSLPTMLGLDALDQIVLDGSSSPSPCTASRPITIGKLVEADKPLIWRGPMAHGAFNQLVTRTTGASSTTSSSTSPRARATCR